MPNKPTPQATNNGERKSKLSSLALLGFLFVMLAACATVPMASERQASTALNFQPPLGEASLYVYRQSAFVGGGVPHPVYLDGRILGNNGQATFLLTTLKPGRHVVSTGVTHVSIDAAPNGLYFIKQTAVMTMSGTMHTSSVQLVSENQGRRGVAACKQASSNF